MYFFSLCVLPSSWSKKYEKSHISKEDKLEKQGLRTGTQLAQGRSWTEVPKLASHLTSLHHHALSPDKSFCTCFVLLFFATTFLAHKVGNIQGEEEFLLQCSTYITKKQTKKQNQNPLSWKLHIKSNRVSLWLGMGGKRVWLQTLTNFITRACKNMCQRGWFRPPCKVGDCHSGCLTMYKNKSENASNF